MKNKKKTIDLFFRYSNFQTNSLFDYKDPYVLERKKNLTSIIEPIIFT